MKLSEYQKLIKECETLGAKHTFLKRIPRYYTLQSEAKLRYAIRQLKLRQPTPLKNHATIEILPEAREKYAKNDAESAVGLIADYPAELHETYMERRKNFLTACSLKIQLNALKESEIQQALTIQHKIWRRFQCVDRANEILHHYRQTKSVLSICPKTDFSGLSALQLVQRRNTLRSNLTARKKTLEKIEKNLPPKGNTAYLKRWDYFHLKKEQYLKVQQDIDYLTALIEKE